MTKKSKLLSDYDLRPFKYQIKGKVTFIDTEKGRFVLKEKVRNKEEPIFKYLNSRNFHYYPKILNSEKDDIEIMEYIEEVKMPKEQKMSDFIDLISLLHMKTTHFVEVSPDDYKKLYESIKDNILYLRSYYDDLLSSFTESVIMSPSEYLFARNYGAILSALNYAEENLEKWYFMVKDMRRMRHTVVHNNLDINHFLRGEKSYLISFGKAKFDIPIFDFYKLYQKNALEYDFPSLFLRYEKGYPLLEEERILLFTLLALPEKIDFSGTEYERCKRISRSLDLLYKTEEFISPYDTKEREKKKKEENKN